MIHIDAQNWHPDDLLEPLARVGCQLDTPGLAFAGAIEAIEKRFA